MLPASRSHSSCSRLVPLLNTGYPRDFPPLDSGTLEFRLVDPTFCTSRRVVVTDTPDPTGLFRSGLVERFAGRAFLISATPLDI
ncbi:hypothetical protein N7540_008111 [Penicillium herquei]|nr:hypothetical protein N7540_008111 [Penicillium herquei]